MSWKKLNFWGFPQCKNLCNFFFVLLVCAGVWSLFNGIFALLFSSFTLSMSLTGFYTKDEPISATRKLKSSNFENLLYLGENSMGSQSDEALKCMPILLTSFSICSWLLISFFSWFSSLLSSSCFAFNCMKTKNVIHTQPHISFDSESQTWSDFLFFYDNKYHT